MEPKKDNIIQKITTERGFADEIYESIDMIDTALVHVADQIL